jgi:hypothetical protein
MKALFRILAALLALGFPAVAQSGCADPDRDCSYAGQWQEANAKNDRDDIDEHARKMEEIMSRYHIPPDTPFDAIATSNGHSRHYDVREFQGRFSPDDQKKFDKAYEHWLNDRRKRDHDDLAKDEGKMQEIMARYNIPRDIPYDVLASGARGY